MPGFFGTSYVHAEESEARTELQKMAELVRHANFYVTEPAYLRRGVAATKIALAASRAPSSNVVGVEVWLEGTIYNIANLARKYQIQETHAENILSQLYSRNAGTERQWDFLRELSGEFALCIVDEVHRSIHLATDRLGSKPVYCRMSERSFAWAHELKAFLGLRDFRPVISPETLSEFISKGYISNNKTWFPDVFRLPGSVVCSFDLRAHTFKQRKYWNWEDVARLGEATNWTDVADELARRFTEAVQSRITSNSRTAVPLSGGLDSRAILAALPAGERHRIFAYTFGSSRCDDIQVATTVAVRMQVNHRVFELNEQNWIQPRIKAIWVSDGMLDLLHMHGVEFVGTVREHADVVLSGILGGGLIGGLFLNDKTVTEIDILEKRIAGRSIVGVTLESFMVEQRLPFFDNDLNEFIFSIPLAMRKNALLYHRMLLRNFGQYFRDIADSNTGCPISYPRLLASCLNFPRRVKRRIYKKYPGFGRWNSSRMHDYQAWIRARPAQDIFRKALLSANAIYPEYLARDTCEEMLVNHMERRADNSAYLCRLLTFEFWLQGVFRRKYGAD